MPFFEWNDATASTFGRPTHTPIVSNGYDISIQEWDGQRPLLTLTDVQCGSIAMR
jgi:hypothetical protein